jgi:hypothetical protein
MTTKQASRDRYASEEDDPVLRDGQRLKVSLIAMDGASHRPHFAASDGVSFDAAEQARDEWIRQTQDAWKGTGADRAPLDDGTVPALEGLAAAAADHGDGEQAKAAAYAAMCARDEQAWRNPPPAARPWGPWYGGEE